MIKGFQAIKKLRQNNIDNTHLFDDELLNTIEKELKALKIIVKKANVRIYEECGIYYFKTTNNLYQISKEKYDLLKDVLM